MGSIYYHGTTEDNAQIILKKGFKKGTYFTWDLHSALVMGGMWVFAIYFEDKGPKKVIGNISHQSQLRKIEFCIYENLM